jgi:hypothetical protein
MVMKGAVQPNHIPVNNFELSIAGAPPILFTKVTGAEVETESVDMPDRTKASGGNTKPTTVTATMFKHHAAEVAYMQAWFGAGQDPVQANYKRTGTLLHKAVDGTTAASETWSGVWVTKKKESDKDLANAGEPAMIEWTLSIDKITPA